MCQCACNVHVSFFFFFLKAIRQLNEMVVGEAQLSLTSEGDLIIYTALLLIIYVPNIVVKKYRHSCTHSCPSRTFENVTAWEKERAASVSGCLLFTAELIVVMHLCNSNLKLVQIHIFCSNNFIWIIISIWMGYTFCKKIKLTLKCLYLKLITT